MGWSRQERIEIHDRLVAMLDDVRKEIMAKYKGVKSVDVGLKETEGKLRQQFAFIIHVEEKKDPNALKPEETIPKEIRGVPTDVQVYRIYTIQVDTSAYSPLWGGIQIGGQGTGGGLGTLGCFVTLTGDTKVHLLTNHHVIIGMNGAVGNLVGHPDAPSVCCCCACGDIGKITAGQVGVVTPPVGTPNIVDAAIAILHGQNAGDDEETRFTNKIINIGPVFGSAAPIPGDIVRKRGRTTHFTEGTIDIINHSPTVNYGTEDNPIHITYVNQIRVKPNAPYPRFSAPGDSGSAIVNNLNQVVGLHFSGSGDLSIANRITQVIDRLGIAVMSSGTAGTIPLSAVEADALPHAHPVTFLARMEQQLQRTEKGKELIQVIRDNRHEVLDLINDNREVKVAWNRYQGPSFVGHLIKNAREPEHQIPRDINGYSFHNLLIKMSDVLERNGSRQLARTVEDYALAAFNFAEAYTGLDSLNNLLEQHAFCPNCGTLNKNSAYAR
ncbi:hypothetical protein Q0590_00125 [Rhodocytophaga aerolata]|uniref:Trypsin-like serine protease n=1 Tax=Rhodocytophaga aerolata TaxID=455078 RepID=A0ABT8QXR1_9BACT|nr:hypothetical protein [Rhodocytophaga aerolata]MDO1444630.1 hypothetical protein [Rhodocytophaga aerolata]